MLTLRRGGIDVPEGAHPLKPSLYIALAIQSCALSNVCMIPTKCNVTAYFLQIRLWLL